MRPIQSEEVAIAGKVSGLPMMVPNREATTFPLSTQAQNAARMKCSVKNGVNEAKAPQAKPSAMRCGLSGRRFIRWPT